MTKTLEVKIAGKAQDSKDSLKTFSETIIYNLMGNKQIKIKGFKNDYYLRNFEEIFNKQITEIKLKGHLGKNIESSGKNVSIQPHQKYLKTVDELNLTYTIKKQN